MNNGWLQLNNIGMDNAKYATEPELHKNEIIEITFLIKSCEIFDLWKNLTLENKKIYQHQSKTVSLNVQILWYPVSSKNTEHSQFCEIHKTKDWHTSYECLPFLRRTVLWEIISPGCGTDDGWRRSTCFVFRFVEAFCPTCVKWFLLRRTLCFLWIWPTRI